MPTESIGYPFKIKHSLPQPLEIKWCPYPTLGNPSKPPEMPKEPKWKSIELLIKSFTLLNQSMPYQALEKSIQLLTQCPQSKKALPNQHLGNENPAKSWKFGHQRSPCSLSSSQGILSKSIILH